MPCIRSYIPTSRRRRENQSVSIGLVHFTFIKRYFLVRVIARQIDYFNPSSSILLFYLMFLKLGQSALHVVSRRPRTKSTFSPLTSIFSNFWRHTFASGVSGSSISVDRLLFLDISCAGSKLGISGVLSSGCDLMTLRSSSMGRVRYCCISLC
jgi:hypothetical protein